MFVDRIIEFDQILRKKREEAAAHNDPTGTIRSRIAAKEGTDGLLPYR